jgi:transposase InsO family protein
VRQKTRGEADARGPGPFGCGGRRKEEGSHHSALAGTERTPPAPELVERNFAPQAPKHLWVADITYVRSWEGWLYLSFMLDTYSRKVVGRSMARTTRRPNSCSMR